MAKRVIVIASGRTEQRTLPLLVAHLRDKDISVDDVRIPPRNGALTAEMVGKLIRAAWYGTTGGPPDKFVVLVDADGTDPGEVLAPFRKSLPGHLGDEIKADVQYAYTQWHLEAWYFADATNLRGWLGGALGSVDASKPDEIQNPKLHLKNILGNRVYTARVSEEIARTLDASTIAQRSPSFKGFLEAIMNGNLTKEAP